MSVTPAVASALGQLLQGLMTTDNARRLEAETELDAEWRQPERVGILLHFLAETAVSGPDDNIRVFAAVLFRRTANRTPQKSASITERTFDRLDPDTQAQLRATILGGFLAAQTPVVRRKIADAVAELTRGKSSGARVWPELPVAVLNAATDSDLHVRDAAFRVLAAAPHLLERDQFEAVAPVFRAGFADASDDVRIGACTAFVAFFRELPKSAWPSLAQLLPSLLDALPMFIQSGATDALAEVLQSLIDLVELAPKMFAPMFPTITDFSVALCTDLELSSEPRLAALELLTTFAEVAPVMCRSTQGYTHAVVRVTLAMLTEVSADDEDAAEWNNDDTSEDDDDEIEYDAARQALDRVSLRLGGQSLAAPLFELIPQMTQSNVWREVFASLMAVSSAAEGCADVLVAELPRLLDMVLPTLTHEHPRVQWAACNALGQMSTDFADTLQRTSGSRVVPALISKLTRASVPRVQAHAAAALVNFAEAAPHEVLAPFLDDLLTNLVALLQSPKRYVQEQVLTTIAIIADAAAHTFSKYHSELVPMLLGFLRTDLGPENRMLTAKCIECSTLIAVAVGRDAFAPYTQELVSIMGELQTSAVDSDDPVREFLEQGWGRICRVVGEAFVPYLPAVLPPLLSAAKAAQDITLLEEDEAEEFTSNEEWDVINLGGKLIAVHVASLNEKASAMDLLRIYATQLKGHFAPWVNEIIREITLPALDFYLHDGVRGSAALASASLLKSTIDATSNNSVETLTIWAQICEKLVEALVNDPLADLLVAYYTALVECINALAPASLSQEQLRLIVGAIKVNLTDIYERMKQREQGDDEFREEVGDEDEDYTDEELLDEINKVISSILKNAKSSFLPEFQSKLSDLISSFISDENTSIKLCGLCVICDVIEHAGPDFDQLQFFRYIASDCLTSPQASIRQAAAYAIGIAAQHGGAQYSQLCVEVLPSLFKFATFPDARADENINATENCIAAIAKICSSFGASIPEVDNVLREWVSLLPIVQDNEAASFAYGFLADLIQNQHSAVVNQAPKVVESTLEAIDHRSISGPVAEKIVPGLRALLESLPQEKAQSVTQKYSSSPEVARYFA